MVFTCFNTKNFRVSMKIEDFICSWPGIFVTLFPLSTSPPKGIYLVYDNFEIFKTAKEICLQLRNPGFFCNPESSNFHMNSYIILTRYLQCS